MKSSDYEILKDYDSEPIVSSSSKDHYSCNWLNKCLAEAIGTCLIVFPGLMTISSAVLTESQEGVWQIAVVWGLAVAIAIYATGSVSGAHLNPAVSIAMAVYGSETHFTWHECGMYIVSQIIGGIIGGAGNYAVWSGFIEDFESENGITRGEAGSERTAMLFAAYFPNPAVYPGHENFHLVTPLRALIVETVASLMITFVVFALSCPTNHIVHPSSVPSLVGSMIAVVISCICPLTQACLNPARDLGPRIVAAAAGWGHIAFPGPRSGFWVYMVAPTLGAILGAGMYLYVFRPKREKRI